MPSVRSTKQLRNALAGIFCLASLYSSAQINSPYSRYGLGDLNMSGNALNRGLGGITAAYSDIQSVNFLNPASYSNIKWVTFDVGAEIESRTMRNASDTGNYTSGNFAFNYLTLGVPLSKSHNWGLAFGLRPYSRVNYSVEAQEYLPNIDTALTYYEGSGGTYKAFIGSGIKFGGFSIGANFGYHFGQQQINTRRIIIPDSLNTSYYKSNSANNTSLGSVFLDGGIQYQAKLKKDVYLQIGGTYNLQYNLKGSRDVLRETYEYDASGGVYTIDSIYSATGQKGNVTVPASYTAGITLQKANKWMIGLQYDGAMWNNFSTYGQKDLVKNSYTYRIGGQITPDYTSPSIGKRITYRAGFYLGKDYVNFGGQQLPIYAATVGLGIPIYHNNYALRQYLTTINLGLEFGARGNDESILRENFFRLHVGFSLSDLSWFQKRRYD